MRKFILTILAVLVVASGLAFSTAAPASANPGSPNCVTLAEWRKIKEGDIRQDVWRKTGVWGVKGRTSYYSDGTKDFSVEYRTCKRGSNKPGPYTTSMYFATEVKYGAYVWDEYDDYVCTETPTTYNCEWVGAYVWDEYAENGVTRTPVITYVGMFY